MQTLSWSFFFVRRKHREEPAELVWTLWSDRRPDAFLGWKHVLPAADLMVDVLLNVYLSFDLEGPEILDPMSQERTLSLLAGTLGTNMGI